MYIIYKTGVFGIKLQKLFFFILNVENLLVLSIQLLIEIYALVEELNDYLPKSQLTNGNIK